MSYYKCAKYSMYGVAGKGHRPQSPEASSHRQPLDMSILDSLLHCAMKIFSACVVIYRRLGITVPGDLSYHSSRRQPLQKGHMSICLSRHKLSQQQKVFFLLTCWDVVTCNRHVKSG